MKTINAVPGKRNPYYSNYFSQVTFSVGAEATNVIRVTGTAKDPNGTAASRVVAMSWWLSTLTTGLDIVATAPSAGIAIGTKGTLIENIADKSGLVLTNASGVFEVDLTDTGTPTFYFVTLLPDGSINVSGAITFA